MNNIENSPDELFDWIAQKNYNALNALQKLEVDRYFSALEYDAMHTAAVAIRDRATGSQQRRQNIRTDLMKRFDEKHKPKQKTIAMQPALWRVAATMLAIGLPLCAYWLIKNNNRTLTNRLSDKADTVYMEKIITESHPVKVYDTVYIVQEKRTRAVGERMPENEQASQQDVINEQLSGNQGLNIQSINKLDSAPNKPKRNAIKDDSLLQHYGFVTL